MLQIDKVQMIDGVIAYGDDQSFNTFYLLPQQPRFRLDAGKPALRFIKYRALLEKEGDLFGGFCVFDSEFVVPEATRQKVVGQLQDQVNRTASRLRIPAPPVKVGTVTYTKGTANLLIGEGNMLVQKVRSAGKPSLFGNNIAAFAVELTKEGAQVFEAALQGERGFVQVVYDLHFWAKLPLISGHGWWHADKFYSFFQDINTEDNLWSEDSYTEVIREQLIQSESMGTNFDWGALTDEKVKNQIRDNLLRQLEDAIARNMLKEIAPESRDTSKLHEEQDIEDIRRDVMSRKIADVNIWVKENQVIEWNLAPQGMLPNITTLNGPDGKLLKWKDYSIEVDMNDPFFKTLNVNIQANADFEQLPIHSIEVKLDYKQGRTHEIGEYVFKTPNDIAKFRSFIENDNWKYKYSYQVNYKGESRTFNSPLVETDDKQLTINVDDLGFLIVEIAPGDLNFTQVAQAQLAVRYEDKDNDIPLIERQFTLDQNHPTHAIKELIFKPRRKPYQYKVKYFMADGKEYEVDWKDGEAPQLYINDPFQAMKTIGLRSVGDLEARINTIFVDLKYLDEANRYVQTKSVALSKSMPFMDWTFPVIDERAGKVSFAGSVQYKDGTVEEIPEQVAAKSTIQIGEIVRDRLEVQIIPELIDFDMVKLAKVSLHYADLANGIDEKKDLIFKKGSQAASWTISLKDKAKTDYEWQATFFMADGSKRDSGKQSTTDPTVVLEMGG